MDNEHRRAVTTVRENEVTQEVSAARGERPKGRTARNRNLIINRRGKEPKEQEGKILSL